MKPCMILTNTRTSPLCKIRFGSNEYSNCSIVCVKFGLILANDELLSFEIQFHLANTQNLKELSFIESN